MARTPSPFEACLAPLVRLAVKFPDMEGQVIWWEATGWQAQEDEEAMLDAEELAFYAEGLLAEGFGLHWQALAEIEAPSIPILTRLFFCEGALPDLPAPTADWTVLAQGRHPVA
ncbi:hypothetical protein [Fuscibacter oryzae]|uniref:Uncharacterized protein n=1 Tax=Fuscibacter oryzae TaxID=2803939 RepID=A0A8J7SX69_9RHOB|nr:hypothetical protein [Fuscibacter oryzae]MBL4929649.1 hypothetical protein [Fuscibacter oryzae]